ncbi:MAG: OadG family protein [Dethiosulfovibrio sp.]|nr:OadG family protein [Dethiosulfovibrio sp.]
MNGAFEGAGGAISLSVIAFSIVFLVLMGLTAIIYGIRIVVEMKGGISKPKVASVSSPAKGQATSPQVKSSHSGISDEVVAAITGALVAKVGCGFRILSVKPQLEGNSDGWTSCGRFEGLEGLDRSPWATGGRN